MPLTRLFSRANLLATSCALLKAVQDYIHDSGKNRSQNPAYTGAQHAKEQGRMQVAK